MRDKLLFTMLLSITLIFALRFYQTLNLFDLLGIFLPIPIYFMFEAKAEVSDENVALFYDDAVSSEMGASIGIPYLQDIPLLYGRKAKLESEPKFNDKGEMFELFMLRHESQFPYALITRTRYATPNGAYYAFLNNELEARSEGELRTWAEAIVKGTSLRPDWSRWLLNRLFKRVKPKAIGLEEMGGLVA